MAKVKTEHVKRRVIENRLLTAITEEDKVAVVVTKRDLQSLINMFQFCKNKLPREQEMLDDLLDLQREAFG